ncbi:sel1 repeat family protein [Dyella lutea]|uniref:Sel1 repeat family protein n=1 Tax=Dyella lutea TaxID=2950441 RepID=A0ABT1F915_9GAMM|nr:sel1 repeat family protein [Dyella lutea]MCP1372782.1 sel1 repeat family protein [Dyella lutea]
MRRMCVAVFVLAGTAGFAQAASQPPKPPEDPQVRALLDGMAEASTWGHPDQFGQYQGMVAYSHGRYAAAMRLFTIGAYYADKVSQLSIGLMYLNGQGVARDPVKAWAWTALAAERGYPRFEATRDGIWKNLSSDQRKQALAMRDELARTYADVHAKPRMIGELRYYRTQLTGSRLGDDPGVHTVAVGPSQTEGVNCMRAARVGLRGAGCGSADMASPEQWDPKLYFKVRDAQYEGTVTVGEAQRDTSSKP